MKVRLLNNFEQKPQQLKLWTDYDDIITITMKYAKHGYCKLANYLNIVFYVRTALYIISNG